MGWDGDGDGALEGTRRMRRFLGSVRLYHSITCALFYASRTDDCMLY